MNPKLLQPEQRIQELESLGDAVANLAEKQSKNEIAQPELNTKGQRWYRGAREILVQQTVASLAEFEQYYGRLIKSVIDGGFDVPGDPIRYQYFVGDFARARALLIAVTEEIKSPELPLKTQLSFAISADEFERALELVDSSGGDEILLRAGGVVGRVALERHLWTVAESHGLTVVKNPPAKKKADTQDLLTTREGIRGDAHSKVGDGLAIYNRQQLRSSEGDGHQSGCREAHKQRARACVGDPLMPFNRPRKPIGASA